MPPNRTDAGKVLQELKDLADPAKAAGAKRYFKTGPGEYGEGDRFLGIRVPETRKLARKHQDLPLGEVEGLLRSEWHEARLLALMILARRYARGDPAERRAVYRVYMKNTSLINNWDLVDTSAEFIVGPHLLPGQRGRLLRLARSRSIWERRIAILATFHYIKRNEFADTLKVARALLGDQEDLIHKAVGWMLREVGQRDRGVEEAFLRRHANRMPRTMLRYAIEHFPERLRRRYLEIRRASP